MVRKENKCRLEHKQIGALCEMKKKGKSLRMQKQVFFCEERTGDKCPGLGKKYGTCPGLENKIRARVRWYRKRLKLVPSGTANSGDSCSRLGKRGLCLAVGKIGSSQKVENTLQITALEMGKVRQVRKFAQQIYNKCPWGGPGLEKERTVILGWRKKQASVQG